MDPAAPTSLEEHNGTHQGERGATPRPPVASDMADPLVPSFWDNAPAHDSAAAPEASLPLPEASKTAAHTIEGASVPLEAHDQDVASLPGSAHEPSRACAAEASRKTSVQQTSNEAPIQGASENRQVSGERAAAVAVTLTSDPNANAHAQGQDSSRAMLQAPADPGLQISPHQKSHGHVSAVAPLAPQVAAPEMAAVTGTASCTLT